MKRYIIALLLLAAFMPGCKKDDYKLNTNLKPVEKLSAPVNNKFTKLQPATSAALSFEWEQARAEDGSLVLYEVVFDKENGDFSNPIAKVASDGGCTQRAGPGPAGPHNAGTEGQRPTSGLVSDSVRSRCVGRNLYPSPPVTDRRSRPDPRSALTSDRRRRDGP